MSGSGNYTLTPNHGLFKPVYNQDVGQWGGHININADTIDSLLATTGATVLFLPLATGGAVTGTVTATVLGVGGATGPTWTTGTAAPSSTQPVGSLYSRVGGAVGATLYVSRGGGTWNVVAGV
jgi:hypothetical protein